MLKKGACVALGAWAGGSGTRELAQQLRVLALLENLGSIPNTHLETHNHL